MVRFCYTYGGNVLFGVFKFYKMQNQPVKTESGLENEEALEPKKLTLQVSKMQTPMRIDQYLTQQVENATRNKVQEAIEEGRVLVNEKVVKSNYRIKSCDLIQYTMLRPPPPPEFSVPSKKII